MRSAIVNGLKNSILFYALSIGVTIAVHIIIGWENKSLFPKSAIVMIFGVLVAIPWAFLNISNLLCPIKRFRNAGELMAHVIFLGTLMVILRQNFAFGV
jgi:glucose dehydrogenase